MRPGSGTPANSGSPSGFGGNAVGAGIGGAITGGFTNGLGGAITGAGAAVGSVIGGGIGASAGTAIAGPVGGVIGSALGSTLGGAAGAALGDALGDALGLNPPPSSNVPPWSNPSGKGGASFAGPIKITFYSPNNFRFVSFDVFDYEITLQQSGYVINFTFAKRPYGKWVRGRSTYAVNNGPNIDPGTLQIEPLPGDFDPPEPALSDDRFPDGYTVTLPPPLGSPAPDPTPTPFPNPDPDPAPTPPPIDTRPEPAPAPTPFPFPEPAPAPAPAPTPPPGVSPSPAPEPKPSPSPAPPPPAPAPAPKPPPAPQPKPKPEPPPPPPKTKTPDLCEDPCIADIQRKLDDVKKGAKIPTTRIGIRIFRACKVDPPNDNDIADYDDITIEVPAVEAANIKELHDRIFELQKNECRKPKPDCIAAVPEWWQVRLGADRPQLIVQYAELLTPPGVRPAKYGAPKYALTIPHYRLSQAQTNKNLFPPYNKGQSMGVLVLADNSKLIVNCNSQKTSEAVLERFKYQIEPELLKGSQFSTGKRKGQALKTVVVYPRIVKYFSTGQKNLKPDWIKYFKDEDFRQPISLSGCAT